MPDPTPPIEALASAWHPLVAAADASPSAAWVVTFLAGAVGGCFATWIVMRSVQARRSARVARALDRIGHGATEEDLHALQSTLPESWQDVATAGRRAVRATDEARSGLAARVRDLEAILQSTTSGFIAIDPTHRVLDLNPAAALWLRVARDAARGRLVQEIARHPELNRLLDDALARGGTLERTVRLEGPPDRELQAMTEPLRDAAGRTLGLLLSLQDVTRLKRLEALRSEFVANVSHELRTPITAIKGYVETLLQVGTDDPARARKFLEIVHRNTVRLSNLVEDLLALASIEQVAEHAAAQAGEGAAHRAGESEGHSLEMAEIAAREVVDEVALLLGPTAEAKSIALRVDARSDARVRANRTLLEQALVNLLSNAIRYSPEGTTVTIGIRALGDECELFVRDQGPGIAPKHLERIFERFYRVDRSRSSAAGGTGLGLAIVKHIAQVHGGRVEVESELGNGSRFALRLPLVPTSAASAIPGL